MEVVELADSGDAGQEHLHEGHASDVVDLFRREREGAAIHDGAP